MIGKKELKWIPFFGYFFWGAGNMMIDRQKRSKAFAGLAQAAQEIKRRAVSIWVFPAGTRHPSGTGMLPFKRGAFYLAVEAQIPIVPVVVLPSTLCLTRKSDS